jgi:signal peptidase I
MTSTPPTEPPIGAPTIRLSERFAKSSRAVRVLGFAIVGHFAFIYSVDAAVGSGHLAISQVLAIILAYGSTSALVVITAWASVSGGLKRKLAVVLTVASSIWPLLSLATLFLLFFRPSFVVGPDAQTRGSRALSTAALAALVLVAIPGVAMLIRESVVTWYNIRSGSMLPTVEIGDHVVVDKRAFGLRLPLMSSPVVEWSEPARGDLVIFRAAEGDERPILARIVATPHNELEVKNGIITVNGRRATAQPMESNIAEHTDEYSHLITLERGGGPDIESNRIPERQYFVLGDNRGDSRDSRYIGPISRDSILGKVVVVYRSRAAQFVPARF